MSLRNSCLCKSFFPASACFMRYLSRHAFNCCIWPKVFTPVHVRGLRAAFLLGHQPPSLLSGASRHLRLSYLVLLTLAHLLPLLWHSLITLAQVWSFSPRSFARPTPFLPSSWLSPVPPAFFSPVFVATNASSPDNAPVAPLNPAAALSSRLLPL